MRGAAGWLLLGLRLAAGSVPRPYSCCASLHDTGPLPSRALAALRNCRLDLALVWAPGCRLPARLRGLAPRTAACRRARRGTPTRPARGLGRLSRRPAVGSRLLVNVRRRGWDSSRCGKKAREKKKRRGIVEAIQLLNAAGANPSSSRRSGKNAVFSRAHCEFSPASSDGSPASSGLESRPVGVALLSHRPKRCSRSNSTSRCFRRPGMHVESRAYCSIAAGTPSACPESIFAFFADGIHATLS